MRREGTVRTLSKRSRLNLALPLVAVLAALAFPATAHAQPPLGFTPCADATGFYCGTVSVPIDRSGLVTANMIPLSVMWKPAAIANTDGALFALAGGPGQAATPYASEFAAVLAPALGTRDLVVYDQRGTGHSGRLECPGADNSATNVQQLIEMCSSELGPARDFYSSKDSAEDIEAVRQAIGIDRIAIFGVSYGTYVAQLYAKLFPTHTAALALDSVVSSTGVDPFSLSNFAAVARVLKANCVRGLCRKVTANPTSDLASLVRRSARGGIRLRYIGSNGIDNGFRVGEADIFDFMVETFSEDAVARARFLAALRSALAGDPYPLGRLMAPAPVSATSNVSTALYFATVCSDTHFPWLASDPASIRVSAFDGALAALPPSDFSPFSTKTALTVSPAHFCVYWPPSTVDTSVTAPFPDVPVLTLSGLEDDLTPLTDAAEVASQLPTAFRVNVPFTGHSVISDVWPDADACVKRALTHFFSLTPIPSCASVKPFFRPVERDPSSLAQVRPLSLKGLPGKTIRAVMGTLSDVTMTVFSGGPSSGLRGGYIAGTLMNVRLHKVVYVPGVVVNGKIDLLEGSGKVTISGKGSHGELSIQRGRNFTLLKGTLDGAPLKIHVRTPPNDAKVAVQLPILLGFRMAARPCLRWPRARPRRCACCEPPRWPACSITSSSGADRARSPRSCGRAATVAGNCSHRPVEDRP